MSHPYRYGVHRDVPFEEYIAWDALSSSRLGLLARSPAHFRAGFTESTDSLRLGSLVHCGVLEPDALAKRYCVEPNWAIDPQNHTVTKGKKGEHDQVTRSWSASTKWVAEQRERFAAENADRELVTAKQYDQFLGIANSIAEKMSALRLFDQGNAEVSICWSEIVDGRQVPCKARVDWLGLDYFVDLKTTQDGMKFERAIQTYGYARQMAWYQRGLSAVLSRSHRPWIIACETVSPYCCRVAPCSPDMLRSGNIEIDRLMALYLDCVDRDNWPGYDDPSEWGASDFASSGDDVANWFEEVAK